MQASQNILDTVSQSIHLVAYPDWSQPEDVLYHDIMILLRGIATHPQHQAIHLALDIGDQINPDTANLLVSDVIMMLLSEDAVDFNDGTEVSLISAKEREEWQLFHATAQARIAFPHGDIARTTALHYRQIPVYKIDDIVSGTLFPLPSPHKLHIGCGQIYFEGWLHVDADESLPTVDLVWDASQPLPFADQSCTFIYNEHFLEHLTIDQGIAFLQECYRLLLPGGVLRIAMPCLETLVRKYLSEDWRNQDWLQWNDYQFIQTRAEMINIGFRWWGHQWLYDREELHRRLCDAGFATLHDVRWGESSHPDLRQRETRKDSLLICEAEK
jgi:predicted SAM-dependent methyltransferase